MIDKNIQMKKPIKKWIFRTLYYFIILLLLFFIYGFHDVDTGAYIYEEF